MYKLYDRVAKSLVGTFLEDSTWLELEHELPHAVQSVDCVFEPRGALAASPPGGWLQRMGAAGPGMLECFSHTVRWGELDACIYKREGLHHERVRRARKERQPRPARPYLWITSTGQPRELLRAYEAAPLAGWPRGFWRLRRWVRVRVVVLPELPQEPETLALRLLGRGVTLRQALAECAALPPGSALQRRLGAFLVACEPYFLEDPELHKETNLNVLEEIQEMYDRFRQEQRQEGARDAKAETLLRLLTRRFGELPEAVTARVARASQKSIERWLDRVLDARTLDDVFAR